MKKLWFALRSAWLWTVSILHFFVMVPILVALSFLFDHRKHDYLQRSFCRRIAFFAGAKVCVRRSAGFDPQRTCFFISNHVNLFDPFVLYCAVPQFVRGWELESHFKIPAYGWLMKHFGNVPVPDVRRPSDLKRMWRLTREAVDGGTSLIVFPEGGRTRDGRVASFQDGAFRLALHLGVPITPVSIVAPSTIIAPATGCSGPPPSPCIFTTRSISRISPKTPRHRSANAFMQSSTPPSRKP